MKITLFFFIGFLYAINTWAQPVNDNCSDATLLCPLMDISGSTTNATLENCNTLGGCADDFPNFGIVPKASVWYEFTTNSSGGTVVVDVKNLIFNPDANLGQAISAMLFNVPIPCQGVDFTQASNVATNNVSNFVINSFALTANTTYYLVIDGAITVGSTLPAECDFDVAISGSAIDVPILPTASITTANSVICQGDSELIDITINNCSDTVSMDWYYNNSVMLDSVQFNTATLTEDGYLKLIINCGTTCVYTDTTDSIFFEVTPIVVDAGEDKLIELGESVVLDGSGTANPVWTPETTLSSSSNFTPTASPEETTTYFLTVSTGVCTLTDEVTVKIKEIITIYSGFTPNGDNTNDVWEIINISQYPNNIVKIYDRSGQIVFKTTGYKNVSNRWDGTFKGKELPASTYFYVIDLRTGGKDSVFKGPVTILR